MSTIQETILAANDTGEIVVNDNGEVVEENYEFGNAFNGRGNLYLETKDNLGLTPAGTFRIDMFFTSESNNAGGLFTLSLANTSQITFFNNPESGQGHILGYNYPAAYPSAIGTIIALTDGRIGRNYFSYTQQGPNWSVITNLNKTPVSGNYVDLTSSDFTSIKFGVGYFYGYDTKVYSSGTSLLAIYNRELFEGEYAYNCNNLSGHAPFSTAGLLGLYENKEAEILDFSTQQDGSDMRVGVRDLSGLNNHLMIQGLPAGSNADRLTYANANQFTLFS